MNLSKCAVLLLSLSAMASVSPAQISISGELDTETYTYRAYSSAYGDTFSQSEISENLLGYFSYQFSSAGETTVAITWSAPEGQVFVVNAPADWNTALINLSYSGGSSATSSGWFRESTITPVFTDLTGSFNSVGSSINLTGPSVADNTAYFNFSAYGRMDPGTSISFTSVSLTAVVASSYTGNFSNVPVNSFKLSASTSAYSDLADPGTWASLAAAPTSAVPEPSTYAALLGGMAFMVTMGRRRRRN
ncbi:PEP-CTERM sorting domain-containing protein [Synoicihabitans lomoniglobus]|uniref:PEP-CTERM sorting domain-containing protein n=1 Tax=Synoicihabitans lomoniglobus TaxID=2909285 RepID=A0AAF0CN59_9BACT|nr:PEP-CTERM sorting domain-containing protein [Opitutaceae bacterium LMO-M01]WED64010.1 PEP-CTERM sorting domain-containing protein [Opitutaceae bacterium LMO-M01]